MAKPKRLTVVAILVLLFGAGAWTAGESGEGCSSLVATAGGTVDGAPLLWKNRDNPSALSNKVVFVEEQPYSYLALVNAEPVNGRLVWAGLNSAGFAVANTATDNLPAAPAPSAGGTAAGAASGIGIGKPGDHHGRRRAHVRDGRRVRAVPHAQPRPRDRDALELPGARRPRPGLDLRDARARVQAHERQRHAREVPSATPTSPAAAKRTRATATCASTASPSCSRRRRAAACRPSTSSRSCRATSGIHCCNHPERAEWSKLPADRPVWLHTNYTINRPSTASVDRRPRRQTRRGPEANDNVGRAGRAADLDRGPALGGGGPPPAEMWEGKDAAALARGRRIKDLLRPLDVCRARRVSSM